MAKYIGVQFKDIQEVKKYILACKWKLELSQFEVSFMNEKRERLMLYNDKGLVKYSFYDVNGVVGWYHASAVNFISLHSKVIRYLGTFLNEEDKMKICDGMLKNDENSLWLRDVFQDCIGR